MPEQAGLAIVILALVICIVLLVESDQAHHRLDSASDANPEQKQQIQALQSHQRTQAQKARRELAGELARILASAVVEEVFKLPETTTTSQKPAAPTQGLLVADPDPWYRPQSSAQIEEDHSNARERVQSAPGSGDHEEPPPGYHDLYPAAVPKAPNPPKAQQPLRDSSWGEIGQNDFAWNSFGRETEGWGDSTSDSSTSASDGRHESDPLLSRLRSSTKYEDSQPEVFFDAPEYPSPSETKQKDAGKEEFFDAFEYLPFAGSDDDDDDVFFDALEYYNKPIGGFRPTVDSPAVNIFTGTPWEC